MSRRTENAVTCPSCGRASTFPIGSASCVGSVHCQHCGEPLTAARRRSSRTPGSKKLLRIARRDAWTCQLCGLPVDPDDAGVHRASVDHITRVVDGGQNADWNLQLAHQSCNAHRHDRRVEPFAPPLRVAS